MLRRPAAVLVVTLLAVAACGRSTSAPGPTVSAHPAATIRLDETANGRTVQAHVGDTVTVTLHSTYWSLAGPTGRGLQVVAAATPRRGATGCPSIPGTGCGTVTATYRASTAGLAQLAAHRSTCGEAMRCRPDQSAWTVHVDVR